MFSRIIIYSVLTLLTWPSCVRTDDILTDKNFTTLYGSTGKKEQINVRLSAVLSLVSCITVVADSPN